MKGRIFKISKLRNNVDGKGITSLIGLWGCPLHCRYCQNHICHDEEYRVETSADEVANVVSRDRIYYQATDGGVVFGGGEPLLQPGFVREVSKLLKRDRISTRIETSLYAPWDDINILIDCIDEWIVDIKTLDLGLYISYTEAALGQLCLENLEKLISVIGREKVHVRIPVIPDYKDEFAAQREADYLRDKLGVNPEIFVYVVS